MEGARRLGIEPSFAEIQIVADSHIRVEGDEAREVLKSINALEEHNDFQHVWTNFDIDEELIEVVEQEG
ncbi:MAG: hypothetical protein JRI25_22575 [Deltaproteobacteria bacterium]|nr:hypothetical protein [Deltaproteobacteria bacterium]